MARARQLITSTENPTENQPTADHATNFTHRPVNVSLSQVESQPSPIPDVHVSEPVSECHKISTNNPSGHVASMPALLDDSSKSSSPWRCVEREDSDPHHKVEKNNVTLCEVKGEDTFSEKRHDAERVTVILKNLYR